MSNSPIDVQDLIDLNGVLYFAGAGELWRVIEVSTGISISATSELTTTESGGSATFTIVVNTQPSQNVSIALSSSHTAEGIVSPASLVFTPSNWHSPQTVTVTGVNDPIDDGDVSFSIITSPAVSLDPNYSGLDAADLLAKNADDDTAGFTVTPITGLRTSEAGGTASFTLALNSQPVSNVTIGLSSSATTEGTVSPTFLTFTSLNWSVAQVVTITGVNDGVLGGDQAYTIITSPATSGDTNYNSLDAADVSVTNMESRGDTRGPQIQSVDPIKSGPSKKPVVSQIVLTFSEDVQNALDPANYRLLKKRKSVRVTPASYDSDAHSVTLNLAQAIKAKKATALAPYTLKVSGAGPLSDLAGNRLDGDGDGSSGDDYSRPLSAGTVVASSIDAVLANIMIEPNADAIVPPLAAMQSMSGAFTVPSKVRSPAVRRVDRVPIIPERPPTHLKPQRPDLNLFAELVDSVLEPL